MDAVVFYSLVLLVFCGAGSLTEWIAERRRHRNLRKRIGRYGGSA